MAKEEITTNAISPLFLKEIDLLLIGKTGNGKSATGNTILGQSKFISEDSCQSVTHQVDYEVVEFGNRRIKVVDGPGIGDTHYMNNVKKAKKVVIDTMQNAVLLNPDGYHAFLIVIRYGIRLTLEERECIRILKAIFGDDFIKKYCILIITGGDLFRINKKLSGKTFKSWCLEQDGVFKELFIECGKRVVLFDNITNDDCVRIKQLKKLIAMIESLGNGGKRYTDTHFKIAASNRKKLMAEVKEPLVCQKAVERMSLIVQKLDAINSTDLENEICQLSCLLKESDDLLNYVEKYNNQTGVLKDTKTAVKFLRKKIADNLSLSQKNYRAKEELNRSATEADTILMEELKKLEHNFQETVANKMLEHDQRMLEIKKAHEQLDRRQKEKDKEFQSREEKIKFETEEEKKSVMKEMKYMTEELNASMCSLNCDTESLKEVEHRRMSIKSTYENKLKKIERRHKEKMKAIEKENFQANKLIKQERETHKTRIDEMEAEMRNLVREHELEKQALNEKICDIKRLFDKEMKDKIQEITDSTNSALKLVMARYENLKKKYDESLKTKISKKCVIQ